jgi:alpha(1,3/1,4) fucosyltransferase
MIRIAYINFWKDPTNDSYFTHFISENICQVQVVDPGDKPDMLIASCMGDINKVHNTDAKYKFFFYGENLDRFPPYNNDELLHQVFDSIVGFRNTNGHIRFPLWLLYYPYYKYSETENILKYIQTQYDINRRKSKIMFATHVARHDRGGLRAQICDVVSAYGEIVYPGEFRNNVRPIGKTTEDKIRFISQSLFNICPENSVAEGYCTEKIFQALEAGTIPVYWGIDLPERGLINEDKYCFGPDLHYPKEGPLFTSDGPKIIEYYYIHLKQEIYRNLYNIDGSLEE